MSAAAAAAHPAKHVNRTGARTLLMVSLTRFYAQPGNLSRALPYLTGTSTMSLRLIDWFVTNYAKIHNVVLMQGFTRSAADARRDASHFNVYLSYRSQLKAYSKLQFDPFRRRERMQFFYQPDKSFETTIGQLNFFRWMIQNNVLDYVVAHAAEIERDMLQTLDAAAPAAGGDEPEEGLEPANPKLGKKARASSAVCCVARNMTRVGGNHTVAFE